mgnify:CR=1 FL=1
MSLSHYSTVNPKPGPNPQFSPTLRSSPAASETASLSPIPSAHSAEPTQRRQRSHDSTCQDFCFGSPQLLFPAPPKTIPISNHICPELSGIPSVPGLNQSLPDKKIVHRRTGDRFTHRSATSGTPSCHSAITLSALHSSVRPSRQHATSSVRQKQSVMTAQTTPTCLENFPS